MTWLLIQNSCLLWQVWLCDAMLKQYDETFECIFGYFSMIVDKWVMAKLDSNGN